MEEEYKQHFGVALGLETIAQLLALLSKFFIVVDFTVENQREPPGHIRHRLMRTCIEVDDRKSCMA